MKTEREITTVNLERKNYLAEMAKKNKRSLSSEVNFWIEQGLVSNSNLEFNKKRNG